MDKHTLPNISIIGSGRVAKSLGAFFLSKGVTIKGIYSYFLKPYEQII